MNPENSFQSEIPARLQVVEAGRQYRCGIAAGLSMMRLLVFVVSMIVEWLVAFASGNYFMVRKKRMVNTLNYGSMAATRIMTRPVK